MEDVEIEAATLKILGPSLLQTDSTVTPVALLYIPNGSPTILPTLDTLLHWQSKTLDI